MNDPLHTRKLPEVLDESFHNYNNNNKKDIHNNDVNGLLSTNNKQVLSITNIIDPIENNNLNTIVRPSTTSSLSTPSIRKLQFTRFDTKK